jgi:hypothetical protein
VNRPRHRAGTPAWFTRPRALAGLAVATAGLTLAVWLPTRGDVAEAEERGRHGESSGRGGLFDDFSGRRDLDLATWSLTGPAGGGALVGDGRLELSRVLTARQRFTGKFGHAEARIRVTRAAGVWRAFAVLDENGRLPEGTLEPVEGGIDPTSGRGFHTYVIDWSPETVTWTVDGKPSLRLSRAEPGGPLTLVLNLDARRRMTVDFVQVLTNDDGPPSASPSPSAPQSPGSAGPTPTASTPPPTDEPTTAAPTTQPPTTQPPTTEPPDSPSASPSSPPSTADPTPSDTPSPTATVAGWAAFTDYAAGDLVRFKGATYRVLEAHTSLPGWEPPKVPDLFAKV